MIGITMTREDGHAKLVQELPIPLCVWQRCLAQGSGGGWLLSAANDAAEAIVPGLKQAVGRSLDELFVTDSGGDARTCTRASWPVPSEGLPPSLSPSSGSVRSIALDPDQVAWLFDVRADDGRAADLAVSTVSFQALLERAFDGIFVRRDDRLIYLNPALLSLLGYERPEELIGRSVLTFIHPDHHALLTQRIHSTDRGQGSEPPICVRCLRRDGSSVWLDGAGMPAKYQGQWAYLVLVRDVTARREEELALRISRETLGARLDVKELELERARALIQSEATLRQRAEEQLRQAQKMDAVGRLAGGIAHDFNNLLSVVLAHSSVLERSLEPEDPRQRSAREVLAAGQRAADLTRQLLALSRRQVLEPRLVDVNASVRRMMSMLGRLVGERIEISLFLDPAIQATKLDPTQLEQVILNLVVNARDAMPRGGQLTLSSSNEVLDAATARELHVPSGPYVLLSVSDTGVGMDEQTRSQIFEPFFTTKELGGGLGLGLSTARSIIEQSGGAIRVETAPAAGARFFVYLPAVGKRLPVPEHQAAASIRTGSEMVAVAEDEPAVRAVMCEVLSNAGYRILAAGTSSEVLRAVQAFDGRLHLLMSDLVMPGMTGIELAHAIRASQRHVRVLIVSGYSNYGELPSSLHFLPKPFTEAELLGKVREALDAPASLHVEG